MLSTVTAEVADSQQHSDRSELNGALLEFSGKFVYSEHFMRQQFIARGVLVHMLSMPVRVRKPAISLG